MSNAIAAPSLFAAAPSTRARQVRERYAADVAADVYCTVGEAADLVEGAVAHLRKLSVADARWIASLRAHRDTASVIRSLSGGLELFHRHGRECDDGATAIADLLVKPSGTPLHRTIRFLLLNPPSLEAELDA